MKIGLTGGLGCGKSTAGKMLEARGFRRIDTDRLVRELLDDDADVHAALQEHWGATVFQEGGEVDRAAIAHIVFAPTVEGQKELKWLENLLHPRVRALWQERVDAAPQEPWVVEIPLLYEKNLENHFDCVICIEAAGDIQLSRLEARGIDRQSARFRISNQMPLSEKVRRAPYVLSNSGTLATLEAQIDRLLETLSKKFSLPSFPQNGR